MNTLLLLLTVYAFTGAESRLRSSQTGIQQQCSGRNTIYDKNCQNSAAKYAAQQGFQAHHTPHTTDTKLDQILAGQKKAKDDNTRKRENRKHTQAQKKAHDNKMRNEIVKWLFR